MVLQRIYITGMFRGFEEFQSFRNLRDFRDSRSHLSSSMSTTCIDPSDPALWCRGWDLGFGVYGAGSRVRVLGFEFWVSGFDWCVIDLLHHPPQLCCNPPSQLYCMTPPERNTWVLQSKMQASAKVCGTQASAYEVMGELRGLMPLRSWMCIIILVLRRKRI